MSVYTVAVRELCEFTAKRGDLDHRFTPAPTAEEGIAGHAIVAARRGATHQAEVWLKSRHQELTVRGRADGYDASRGRLEEVKTHKGTLDRQPPSHRLLHWAQAKVYAWLLCERDRLDELDVVLVYFDIGSQRETPFVERCSALELRQHFVERCELFIAWAQQEAAHRAQRDAALRTLAFPFPVFRQGQRRLAESVYNAARSGRCLLVEAPTGSGKTLGTIFPMLKAMTTQGLDKIFYLTAKGSGRQLALDALQRFASPLPGPPLRVLELVARSSACEFKALACHGDSCPLAKGFYDRLPAARHSLLQLGAPRQLLDQAAVRQQALAHQVCPYYLSQELVRWADVVIGDYNYWFDQSALLYSLRLVNDWQVGLLVDEAHNLVDRARSMYTAELRWSDIQAAAGSPTAAALAPLRRAMSRIKRSWKEIASLHDQRYCVLEEPPARLLDALQRVNSEIAEVQADAALPLDSQLLDFYFASLALCNLADSFGTHSLVDLQRHDAATYPALCIRNIVPAPFVGPRVAGAKVCVLFSATLQPFRFYGSLLGLPTDHVTVEIESPFDSSQLNVRIAEHISTRFRDRVASVKPIAKLMSEQFRRQPGNYVAYFGSYAYMSQVAAAFSEMEPDVPAWAQSAGMNSEAQRQFLERFVDGGTGLAFAVLGGVFAEGVDLPGRRLVGAFISTLGLPQVNEINEEFRRRIDAMLGMGYEYVYLYPGLRKVVQAAGRVIRTPTDQGVVVLIDDRYRQAATLRLLPRWWDVGSAAPAPQRRGSQ